MPLEKRKKKTGNETRASVEKELAKPRMAKSARIAERDLDTTRVPEESSTTIPGKVNKIIPPRRRQREKAEISVDHADHRHRDLRIENSLTDKDGYDVKLKKGAHVEVTVTSKKVIPRS